MRQCWFRTRTKSRYTSLLRQASKTSVEHLNRDGHPYVHNTCPFSRDFDLKVSASIDQTFHPDADLKKLYYAYLGIGAVVLYLSWALPIGIIIYSTMRPGDANAALLFLFLPFVVFVSFTAFWIPRFYSSISYLLGDSDIVVERGVWWKRKSIVPYNRVTNIEVTQGPLSRQFALGKVSIQTAGFSSGGSGGTAKVAEAVVFGVKNFEEVKEFILAKVKRARPVAVEAEAESPPVGDVSGKILEELKRVREILEAQRA